MERQPHENARVCHIWHSVFMFGHRRKPAISDVELLHPSRQNGLTQGNSSTGVFPPQILRIQIQEPNRYGSQKIFALLQE